MYYLFRDQKDIFSIFPWTPSILFQTKQMGLFNDEKGS